MAATAEGELQIRFRFFLRVFKVLGQFAMALRAWERGMFASYFERFDLLVTLVTFRRTLWSRFLRGTGKGDIKG
jgi:hypothetical protein